MGGGYGGFAAWLLRDVLFFIITKGITERPSPSLFLQFSVFSREITFLDNHRQIAQLTGIYIGPPAPSRSYAVDICRSALIGGNDKRKASSSLSQP